MAERDWWAHKQLCEEFQEKIREESLEEVLRESFATADRYNEPNVDPLIIAASFQEEFLAVEKTEGSYFRRVDLTVIDCY